MYFEMCTGRSKEKQFPAIYAGLSFSRGFDAERLALSLTSLDSIRDLEINIHGRPGA